MDTNSYPKIDFANMTREQIEAFKAWFLARCLPDCPMEKWIPAVEALPALDLLNNCAVEWRLLVSAGVDEWRRQ